MKLQLTEPILSEASRVLSVLIQAYAAQSGSNVAKSHADEVQRGLILALDDVSRSKDGAARPIPELIKLFARTYNVKQSRYSVATAPHPFGFDQTSDVEHYDDLATAMIQFGHRLNAMQIGWTAVLDHQEGRVIGEVYL